MRQGSRTIGIDIGGTKMAVAAVDGAGGILARVTLATEAERGFARAVDRLVSACAQMLREAGWQPSQLGGIGIGCAGPVDPARGLINNPYTLAGWDRCDIVSPLRERLGVPVCLENDADMAALGECLVGAGQGCDPVVMLTFGTGIGGAAIVGGQIYRGVRGEHPELGHLPTIAEGPACYCGRRGCLEAIASGTAMGEAGRAVGLADAPAVFAAAQAGSEPARRILDRAVEATSIAAWTILHTFLPQRFVLGGGIIEQHFDPFAEAVRKSIAAATLIPCGQVTVAPAQLGNDAGLVGAARAAALRPAS